MTRVGIENLQSHSIDFCRRLEYLIGMLEKRIDSLDQIGVFHKEPLTVLQLLPGGESPDMSLALIAINGVNEKVRNLESNATYMLLAGNVCFILWEGDESVVVSLAAGDSVHIPAGKWYQDIGRGIMVSKNHKAFDATKVEYEE